MTMMVMMIMLHAKNYKVDVIGSLRMCVIVYL